MKKFFVLMCISAMISNVSFASAIGGYDAGALNSQYVRDLRLHEFAQRAKNNSAIVKTNSKTEETQAVPETTVNITKISFVNNKNISSEDLARITSYMLNKPATDVNIAQVRKTITRYYQADGFYSAIVFPDTSRLSEGELIFEVQEGSKNSITVE